MLKKKLLTDLTVGLTVSFAAISLGAAFGVMSGRGAFAGIIGAAIIPIITSIFGGTRLQASGPTAPMTAISAIVIAFAYDQFPEKELAEQFITLVFMLNALLLILASVLRFGNLISLVPNVVILGFMNGIALLIWFDQVKKIFIRTGYPEGLEGMGINLGIAIITFILIIGISYFTKNFPVRGSLKLFLPPIIWSIILVTALTLWLELKVETIQIVTSVNSLKTFLDMVINYFPVSIFKVEYLMDAIPYAFQLTLLAYLDSLLTALVIDKLTKEKTKLNKELFAQGLGNFFSGLFQGIPGAQATIRSVLLVKEGAQTRMAGVFIGVFVLLILFAFQPFLSLIPAAVFSGILLKVGWDVCDKDFGYFYFKNKWYRSGKRNIQLFFIVFTTIITVLINLNIAVISGTILFYVVKYWLNVKDVEGQIEPAITK